MQHIKLLEETNNLIFANTGTVTVGKDGNLSITPLTKFENIFVKLGESLPDLEESISFKKALDKVNKIEVLNRIGSEADLLTAEEIKSSTNALWKQVDELRTSYTKPVLEFKYKIDDYFSPIIEKAKEKEASQKKITDNYKWKLEQHRRDEAARQRAIEELNASGETEIVEQIEKSRKVQKIEIVPKFIATKSGTVTTTYPTVIDETKFIKEVLLVLIMYGNLKSSTYVTLLDCVDIDIKKLNRHIAQHGLDSLGGDFKEKIPTTIAVKEVNRK